MAYSLDHFTVSGRPKFPFETKAEALAFRSSRLGFKSKKPHQCLVCGKWHLDTRQRANEFQRWYNAR